MKPSRSTQSMSLLFGAILAAHANAQQGPADAVHQVEVKGDSSVYDPRRDDTASRIVVRRDEIVRHGDRSVLDVLKRVPGVTVDGSQGRGRTIQMRGLASYTQVLVNGERAPSGFDLDSLSPELVERIEVLRAATADLPTQSVAGTVNIVLRRVSGKAERQFKLGVLDSSLFRGPNASLRMSERGDAFAWSLAAEVTAERFGRVWSGIETNTRPDGVLDRLRVTTTDERGRMRRFGLTPRLEWTREGRDTVSLEAILHANRFRNHAPGTVTTDIGAPPPVPVITTAMRADAGDATVNLNWSRQLASSATLEMKVGFVGEDSDNTIDRDGLDATGTPATDGFVDVTTRQREVNSTGKVQRKLEAGHMLSFGWDGGVDRRDDTRLERDAIRVFPPGLALDERFDGRVSRLALYAQDEWNLTPQWSMYAGVRWEGMRTRVTGGGIDPVDHRSSVWSPLLQTLWKIPGRDGKSRGDQLRLALSRTYKAPEVNNLIPRRNTWENNSPTEADFQGNPELRPELANGVDLSYEIHWAPQALLSVSGSVRRIRDYTSNRIFFDGYRWIFTPVNDGRARTRTLELEAKFPLKALFATAPAIDLRAAVSRHWSRVDAVPGPDNRLERQTPLSANAGIDWTSGRLSAGGSASFTRNGRVRVTENREYYSEAVTDLEAYAAWKLTPPGARVGQLLRLALSNLHGEDGGFAVSYADPLAGVERRRWTYPGTVRVQATYEANF